MKQQPYFYKFGEKLSIGNADNIFATIVGPFNSQISNPIVFDLENLRLCDSYGLKLFINFQRKAESLNKKLILYRPDAILRDTLALTKLEHIFMITDTLDLPAD